MWLIPRNAERPSDARVKNPVVEPDYTASSVRKDLKRLLKAMFKTC